MYAQDPHHRQRSERLIAESLESRFLLSIAPVVDEGADFVFPTSIDSVVVDPHDDEIWVAHDEASPAGSTPVDAPAPLPAIPFDDSVAPLSDCPGLDDDFCLPDDTSSNSDDVFEFDFADFLLLHQNYGMENARWEDGDFDGDGQVGFSDLLLLSSHF